MTIIQNTKLMVIKIKYYQLKNIFKITPYLKGIINNHKNSSTWKSQLTITISFFSYEGDKVFYRFSWLDKNKNATINPINKKNKCFRYAVTVVLNFEIKKDQQRITKIKPFINKHSWQAINYPSEINDWKKLEKINVTIALNDLYAKKKKYTLLMF